MSPVIGIILLLASTMTPVEAETPESVVFQVYRDFACEAVMERPECKGLLEQPRSVLRRYFDENLANLILADRGEVERTGESGRIDFLPIWDSQDPSGIAVKAIQRDGSAAVKVTLQRLDGSSHTLTFRLSHTKQGWRISDIETREWSLMKLLKR